MMMAKAPPLLGFGTYQMDDPQALKNTIDAALSKGYRLIDSAAVYKNEEVVGQSLKESLAKYNLQVGDVYVTTKLAPFDHGYEKVLAAIDRSLEALGRSYVDLYLVHFPGVRGLKREDPQNAVVRRETWRAMEEIYRSGKAKAIGVSNYTVKHLKEMKEYATVQPCAVQSECHPLLVQKEVREYCKANNIFFQAYTSLGQGHLLTKDEVVALADKYKKSPAQILLRWAVQQGIGVIPKASSAKRVEQNADIFDFEMSEEDIQVLSSLDENHHYCWDPNNVA